jgi:hypothetical protein
MMKYRMYVDEVGNPDLESSANINHRFLSLTGVVMELGFVRDVLHPEMEDLKSRHFNSHPDDPIIFHRKEMVNYRYPFEVLKNELARKKFDNDLLECLKRWEYTVISVCIDKKNHKETYQTWRYDPYHYCMALLLERFIFFLEQMKSLGDVMAESRGGKEDRKLGDSFFHLWEKGSDYVTPARFQNALTSKQLKIKPKAINIFGLQLADLVAHPSRNEILLENGINEIRLAPFAEKIIGILQTKYYRQSGKIYGKKFI